METEAESTPESGGPVTRNAQNGSSQSATSAAKLKPNKPGVNVIDFISFICQWHLGLICKSGF
jgi:hypothetical protein